MERKIEGYWYSKHEPNYPKPVTNILTEDQAKEIYDLIIEKEKEAKIIHYKGFSISRITKEMLGSREYQTDEWSWPEDFGPHYVLEHRVKPSDEFLKYIGYENNKITQIKMNYFINSSSGISTPGPSINQ